MKRCCARCLGEKRKKPRWLSEKRHNREHSHHSHLPPFQLKGGCFIPVDQNVSKTVVKTWHFLRQWWDYLSCLSWAQLLPSMPWQSGQPTPRWSSDSFKNHVRIKFHDCWLHFFCLCCFLWVWKFGLLSHLSQHFERRSRSLTMEVELQDLEEWNSSNDSVSRQPYLKLSTFVPQSGKFETPEIMR